MSTQDWFSQQSRSVRNYINRSPRLQAFLMVGPTVGLLLAFFVTPLLIMVWYAFMTGLPPASYTLDNFIRIADPLYLGIIWRTILLASMTTILVVVLGYTFAYSIVRLSSFTTILLLLVILPFWTNYVVRMYAWINILQREGLLNWIGQSVGLIQEPVRILYSNEAVLVGMVYVWFPLAVLPFYASIKSMDEDLIEAAKDLGAGPMKTFVTVTLPMTKTGIYAGAILVAVPAFGAFVTPALLGGTESVMIGNVIDNQFGSAFNWNFGAALSVFITVFVMLALFLAAIIGIEDRIIKKPSGGKE